MKCVVYVNILKCERPTQAFRSLELRHNKTNGPHTPTALLLLIAAKGQLPRQKLARPQEERRSPCAELSPFSAATDTSEIRSHRQACQAVEASRTRLSGVKMVDNVPLRANA